MKTVVLNDNELNDEEMDAVVVKARAVIVNSENELYLSRYGGLYLLPGGKVEEDETLLFGLKRELSEEIGIVVKKDDFEPLVLIKHYIKDYPKRDTEQVYNRLNITYYYFLKSDKDINIDESNLTFNETKNNFKTIIVGIEKAKELVENNGSSNPRIEFYNRELEIIFEMLNSSVAL